MLSLVIVLIAGMGTLGAALAVFIALLMKLSPKTAASTKAEGLLNAFFYITILAFVVVMFVILLYLVKVLSAGFA